LQSHPHYCLFLFKPKRGWNGWKGKRNEGQEQGAWIIATEPQSLS
jgi:hypothetical protein